MEWKKLKEVIEDIDKKVFLDVITPFEIIFFSIIEKNMKYENKVKTYLNNIGFPLGKKLEEIHSRKSKKYMPLIKEKLPILNGKIDSETLHRSHNEIFNFLKESIFNKNEDQVLRCLEYSIADIFNNIESHSKATEIKFFAQKLLNGQIEIVIYDNGIGFGKTFNTTEKKALNLSVFKMQSSTNNNERGRGLQLLKTFCINKIVKGEFLVISNNYFSYCAKKSDEVIKKIEKLSHNIKGTIIVLRLNDVNENTNLKEIREIIEYNLEKYIKKNKLID